MTHGSAVRSPFDSPAFELGLERRLAQGKWNVTVVEPTTSDTTDFSGLDDSALVAACVSGRREAFDVIVERHRRTVYQRLLPLREQSRRRERPVAGGLRAGLAGAEELQGPVGVVDLAAIALPSTSA